MKKTFYFFPVLFFLLSSCAHAPKDSKEGLSKIIPEKGNSLYYYLVSELQNFEGKGDEALLFLEKAIKKDPASSHLLIEKAYEMARMNKLDEALELAQQGYSEHANDVELNILLGKIYSTRKDYDRAFQHYQKALAGDRDNEEIYNLIAREYMAANKPHEAIRILKQLTDIKPETVSAYYYMGSIYAAHLKDYSKALKAYEAILEFEPDNARILEIIAEIHLAQKNRGKALEIFDRLGEAAPADPAPKIRSALLLYEMKDLEGAIGKFESILSDNPASDKILYYLGLLYEEKEDDARALSLYERIPDSSEFYVEAVVRQAVIRKGKGEIDSALELAKSVLAKHPQKLEFYDLLASLYLSKKDYDRAVQTIKQGLSRHPKNEELLMSLGVIQEKKGDTVSSLSTMKSVLEVNPENPTALNFIGYTYLEKGENLEEAEKLISKAFSLRPDDGYIMDSLGWVYYQKGDYQKALALLEKANKLIADEPTILEHLGDIHLQLHDKKSARKFFEDSLYHLRKKEERDSKEEEQIGRLLKKLGGL